VDDARRLWTLVEPFHAIVYFAPEVSSAFEGIGLRGFWRGYFAGRSAPLGAVGPGVISACFFGFRPDFVARAIPSIWSIATPDQALEARLAGVEAALGHLVDIQSRRAEIVEAATLIRAGLQSCSVAGRPMFGANAELAWPSEPHLALWHATTLVREHRGDAHVAALSVAGLDPRCRGFRWCRRRAGRRPRQGMMNPPTALTGEACAAALVDGVESGNATEPGQRGSVWVAVR